MTDPSNIGRIMIFCGLGLAGIGVLVLALARLGLPLFQLPGDIKIQGQAVTCFIPLATMLVLSLILTLVLNLVLRAMNK
ncbi:MAG TPA: DUF2905 domain-containing protein [Anaerolineales bacterium]|nr:DUF2905 domain-containing protein [Anaerolineales bacterium]